MEQRFATALSLSLALGALVCAMALPGATLVASFPVGGGETRPARRARADIVVPPASSGPRAETAVFAALTGGRAPLAPAERERLLGLLRARPAAALAGWLEEQVAGGAPERARLVALECLSGRAMAGELASLVRIADPADAPPSPGLLAVLRAALLQVRADDSRAFDRLVDAWQGARAELRAELLAVVGERGDPAGLEFLAWVATFELQGFERAVASELLRLAPRARTAEAREPLADLCVLLDSSDPFCVQTASSALARARVEAAVPGWIELLASESRGVRERARHCLETVSGLSLGPTRERWLAWYEAELAWYEHEAPGACADLDSGDEATVLAAIRALAGRHFFRDELAQALSPVLEHPSPAVRLCACRALAGLGSWSAVPSLVHGLEDENEDVSRAAWSALRAISGLDLPPDGAMWRAQLGPAGL